jgi:hypothetical protein
MRKTIGLIIEALILAPGLVGRLSPQGGTGRIQKLQILDINSTINEYSDTAIEETAKNISPSTIGPTESMV